MSACDAGTAETRPRAKARMRKVLVAAMITVAEVRVRNRNSWVCSEGVREHWSVKLKRCNGRSGELCRYKQPYEQRV